MYKKIKRWFPVYALKNISFLTVGKFIQYTGGFLYGVFGAWILGAEGFGQLVLIISVVHLIKIPFTIPLGPPLLKLVRTRLSGEGKLRNRDYAVTCFLITGIASVMFGVLFLIFLYFGAPHINFFEAWQRALGLYALSRVISIVRSPTTYLMDAYEKYGWHSFFMVWYSLFSDILPVIFMYFAGIWGACLGYLIGEIIIFISNIIAALKIWGKVVLSSFFAPRIQFIPVFFELYRNVRSAYVAKLMKTPYQKIVNLLIGSYVSPAGTGYYNIAMKFEKIFRFVVEPIKTYLFPRLVKKWSQRSKKEFFYTLRKYFYQLGPTYLLLALLIGLMSPWLIPILYSPEFTPAIPLVYILLPAFVFLKLFNIFHNITFVISQQRGLVNEAALKLVLGVPIAFFLIFHFGYIGAAWAYLATTLIVVIYQIYFFHKHFKWRWLIPPHRGQS